MSEEQAPFTPFTLDTDNAPAAAPAEKKNCRKKAGKKKATVRVVPSVDAGTAVVPAGKKPRKVRKACGAAKAPREAKLPLATILSATAGLKETDAHLLSQMVAALQQVNKGGRTRIVGALGRIFA